MQNSDKQQFFKKKESNQNKNKFHKKNEFHNKFYKKKGFQNKFYKSKGFQNKFYKSKGFQNKFYKSKGFHNKFYKNKKYSDKIFRLYRKKFKLRRKWKRKKRYLKRKWGLLSKIFQSFKPRSEILTFFRLKDPLCLSKKDKCFGWKSMDSFLFKKQSKFWPKKNKVVFSYSNLRIKQAYSKFMVYRHWLKTEHLKRKRKINSCKTINKIFKSTKAFRLKKQAFLFFNKKADKVFFTRKIKITMSCNQSFFFLKKLQKHLAFTHKGQKRGALNTTQKHTFGFVQKKKAFKKSKLRVFKYLPKKKFIKVYDSGFFGNKAFTQKIIEDKRSVSARRKKKIRFIIEKVGRRIENMHTKKRQKMKKRRKLKRKKRWKHFWKRNFTLFWYWVRKRFKWKRRKWRWKKKPFKSLRWLRFFRNLLKKRRRFRKIKFFIKKQKLLHKFLMKYLCVKKKNLYSYLKIQKQKKKIFQEVFLQRKKSRVLWSSDLFFLKKVEYIASRYFGVKTSTFTSIKKANNLLWNGFYKWHKSRLLAEGDLINFQKIQWNYKTKLYMLAWCRQNSKTLILNYRSLSFLFSEINAFYLFQRFRVWTSKPKKGNSWKIKISTFFWKMCGKTQLRLIQH